MRSADGNGPSTSRRSWTAPPSSSTATSGGMADAAFRAWIRSMGRSRAKALQEDGPDAEVGDALGLEVGGLAVHRDGQQLAELLAGRQRPGAGDAGVLGAPGRWERRPARAAPWSWWGRGPRCRRSGRPRRRPGRRRARTRRASPIRRSHRTRSACQPAASGASFGGQDDRIGRQNGAVTSPSTPGKAQRAERRPRPAGRCVRPGAIGSTSTRRVARRTAGSSSTATRAVT